MVGISFFVLELDEEELVSFPVLVDTLLCPLEEDSLLEEPLPNAKTINTRITRATKILLFFIYIPFHKHNH